MASSEDTPAPSSAAPGGQRVAKHIGIVAVSAEGAALCYRTVCMEGAALLGRHAHPEVTMHTYPLADYMRHIDPWKWDEVGEMLLASAEKLRKAGADLLICPDNTAHAALDIVRDRSPLPWLHIAEEVATVAAGARLQSGPRARNSLSDGGAGVPGKAAPERNRVRDSRRRGPRTDQHLDPRRARVRPVGGVDAVVLHSMSSGRLTTAGAMR